MLWVVSWDCIGNRRYLSVFLAVSVQDVFRPFTHEALVIGAERAISGVAVTRAMDRLAIGHVLRRVIRGDNGKRFGGEAIVTMASRAACNCA
jgi:hypothetical protein